MFKFIISFLLVLFISVLFEAALRADVIKLVEGTILVGKIVNENGSNIVFRNTYGTFTVRKSDVIYVYRTRSYIDDVKFQKKINKDVDVRAIRRNIEAGERAKEKTPGKEVKLKRKDYINFWTEGRINISGSFLYNIGKVGNKIPFGFSGHIALDQGLEMIIEKHHPLIPGTRSEMGYLYFKKGPYSVTGFNMGAGPLWAVPSMKNRKSSFVFAFLPGISFLDIKNNRTHSRAKSNTFTVHTLAGYQLSFGPYSVFFHARYMYIYDKEISLHSISGGVGVGYKVW